jgi:protein ImuB
MVVCVLIPRFALRVAGGERCEGLLALAPQPGARRVVGEVSSAAEERGVRAGMALGEALARCPSLRLIPADPARAATIWEELLRRLEGIGAAIESERSGEAFFATEGLRALHGGERGVLAAAREAIGVRAQIALAPNRFAASLAAERGTQLSRGVSEPGAEAIISPGMLRRFLAPTPVASLLGALGDSDPGALKLIDALRRLGLGTLGGLAELRAAEVADRFGPLGLRALRLAHGEDAPLRPRQPPESLECEIELPDGAAGEQLDRALALLVELLLAAPGRRDRTLLSLRLSASLCAGGSWSVDQVLSRPSASAQPIASLLAPRLQELPGPVSTLGLRAIALGRGVAEQLELSPDSGESGERLESALREVRATAGAEALLEVIDVDPRSRVPERRMALSPYRRR